jgi:CRP/FNR family transcriptional regulator
VVPKGDYENLLCHYPTFARARLEEMSHRLKTAERMMQEIAYSTVKQRILLILTKIGCEIGTVRSDGVEFTLNWSHHELASMIGSTRETVTSNLSLLQKEGLIKIEGKRMTITQQASLDGAHMQ